MTLKAPRRSRAAQAGFTLVEIAIVLVIIGLLLGGVLKGQELIENGRVKSAANDFNGILAAHNSYFDRYRRLPGDDGNGAAVNLTNRGGAWTNVAAFGNSDGIFVADPANTFAPLAAEEADGYFSHLRAAGFLNGDPVLAGAAALPVNPWGGLVGVTVGAAQGRTANNLLLCFGSVPGKGAQALDTQFDDGSPVTGNVRATQGGTNTVPTGVAMAAGSVYNENNEYTICREMR
jgi:prepilin-type N-terminal cleavage/methylation domain-containing protein